MSEVVGLIPLRREVIPAPASRGRHSYFTSRGDNIGAGTRGTGALLRLTHAGTDTQTQDIQFLEPVEIHDGEAFWDSAFDFDDELSFCLVVPAATIVANAGAGNCNLTAITGGNLIVPAPATDGSHDVTLSTAPPAPAEDGYGTPNGYWNVDWKTGTITAVADIGSPNGNSHLRDFEIIPKMIPSVSMGSPRQIFAVETYRVQNVHPNHKLRMKVIKNSAGAGEVGAWLLAFREITV